MEWGTGVHSSELRSPSGVPTHRHPVRQRTHLREHLRVTCADGYEGTNLQNVTCHSTGNWSLQAGALQPVVGGPDLFCKKKDCGNISSPANGGLTCSGTRYQDSCRLTCEPGYKVADESGHVLHSLYNFRCMASGQWNKKPRCVPSDYCHLGLHDCHAEHGVCSLSGHQAFSCRCRVGTVGDGRHCERTSCPDFPVAEPENGFFSCSILTSSAADACQSPDSTEPEYEVVCVLHCDPGYDRLIYAEYSCGHGGNWSIPFNTNNPGTTPCLAVKCPDLSSPLNGSMTCDSGYEFRHPEACSFACDTGYELTPTSSSARHCKADATWSGSDAKCIGVRCPTLSSPMNGKMSCNSAILPSAFRHPETCNFTCHDGFGLSTGSNKISRTCQADGTWSESNAVCVCVASSDLFFVLDGSGSVGTGNFDAVKTFVANIVSTFIIGATATRVGVVQYSSSNTLEFNLGSHTSQTATVNAISAITYQNGGTLTGAAMDFARQHAAWRPSPIRRIMIVVTDGSSHDSVVAPSRALTADGVTVFAIGVSGYDSTQLLQITNNVPSRVFELTDFIGLSQNINQIVQALCNL
ncbi:P-selectin-like [Branchiostoma floridae]|uniref:P-selectin-like n=1 Tax=Branchiostoma floridae TaxID=7739 RepID=A0A9J7N9Z3_BRAFL|nr:P-selectin-like [Branchiostoma floridae]